MLSRSSPCHSSPFVQLVKPCVLSPNEESLARLPIIEFGNEDASCGVVTAYVCLLGQLGAKQQRAFACWSRRERAWPYSGHNKKRTVSVGSRGRLGWSEETFTYVKHFTYSYEDVEPPGLASKPVQWVRRNPGARPRPRARSML